MVVFFVIPIIFFIILFYLIRKDKLNFIEVKIDTTEEKINETLIKRREILKDAEIKIKEIVKTKKKVFENLDKLSKEKNDMFELDKKLLLYKKEFYLIFDKFEELKGNEEVNKIAFSLGETSDQLETYKNYYNKYAEKYNKYISSFPIILTNLFARRKKLEFFDE